MIMSSPPDNSASDAIRADIAGVDASLLALAAQRLELDQHGFVAPAAGPPLRPALEVKVLRDLLAQAPRQVEPELIVEIWRALMAAGARKHHAFDVAVGGARNDPVRLYDVARRHFGARTRIAHVGDPQAALMRAVENPETCVAVTPWPSAPGVGSWWPALSESRFHKLHIIAGLPVLGAGDLPEACVFSAGRNEEAGKDVSLLLVEDPHHRVQRALQEAGLDGREIARSEPRALVRVEGFIGIDDPRAKLMGATVERVRVLGGYARI
jgi:chorismate mutase